MSRVLLALLLASTAHAADPATPDLKLSGYYKNLLVHSQTVVGSAARYTFDLNRLRLEVSGKVNPNIALDLQYDNELIAGSYVKTQQFALQSALPPATYWDLESTYARGGAHHARHRIYRGNVTVSAGDTDVRLGRQRIAWGTGRFWSPLDLLNPFSPTAVERAERIGVDAALVEHKLSALSRVSAVYAPAHDRDRASAALYWHSNAQGVDYSLVGGRFRREDVIGGDIATQVGGAGVRAELTHNRPPAGGSYERAVLAGDYAFPNTLTLSAELYYNGAGASDSAAYDFASVFNGRIQNVGRRYFGGYIAYDVTPLVKSVNYVVVNLSDHSTFLSPTVTFSLRSNLDFTLGVQLFAGSAGSEYARFRDLYYAQLQWFF